MKRARRLAVLLLLAACGSDERGLSLFDGQTLAGWSGDPQLWRVEAGEIVGSTDGVTLTQNSYLAHERSFGDFVLRAQWKLRNHNSGIQFRNETLPSFTTRGYQGDIADLKNGTMGILYEERGRGFVSAMAIPGVYDHVDLTDWNDYEVRAVGHHITLTINDFVAVDLTDPSGAGVGFFALQLHVGEPMEVRYRNLRVEELQSAP